MKSAQLWSGAFALGLCCVACSLLIGSEPTPLGCSEEGKAGPPACDPGFVCRSGVCQEAEALPTGAGEAGAGGTAGNPTR